MFIKRTQHGLYKQERVKVSEQNHLSLLLQGLTSQQLCYICSYKYEAFQPTVIKVRQFYINSVFLEVTSKVPQQMM